MAAVCEAMRRDDGVDVMVKLEAREPARPIYGKECNGFRVCENGLRLLVNVKSASSCRRKHTSARATERAERLTANAVAVMKRCFDLLVCLKPNVTCFEQVLTLATQFGAEALADFALLSTDLHTGGIAQKWAHRAEKFDAAVKQPALSGDEAALNRLTARAAKRAARANADAERAALVDADAERAALVDADAERAALAMPMPSAPLSPMPMPSAPLSSMTMPSAPLSPMPMPSAPLSPMRCRARRSRRCRCRARRSRR
jgi:hypothetical protein